MRITLRSLMSALEPGLGSLQGRRMEPIPGHAEASPPSYYHSHFLRQREPLQSGYSPLAGNSTTYSDSRVSFHLPPARAMSPSGRIARDPVSRSLLKTISGDTLRPPSVTGVGMKSSEAHCLQGLCRRLRLLRASRDRRDAHQIRARMRAAGDSGLSIPRDASRDEKNSSLKLTLEGLGVAMLASGSLREVAYASVNGLDVHAEKRVSSKGVALELKVCLATVNMDVQEGKTTHTVLMPYCGSLQMISGSQSGEPPPVITLNGRLHSVTEDKGTDQSYREGSEHLDLRKLNVNVNPLDIRIGASTAFVVCLWLDEMEKACEQEQHMVLGNYIPEGLQKQDGSADDPWLGELSWLRDPSADDFKGQKPLFIRDLKLCKVRCVISSEFSSRPNVPEQHKEKRQQLEFRLRFLMPFEFHKARLFIGKNIYGLQGWKVENYNVSQQFLPRGPQELLDEINQEAIRSVTMQIPKLLGSQLLFGNPLHLWEELSRAAELGARGMGTMKPHMVLAALFLTQAALLASVGGSVLVIAKGACRLIIGDVPHELRSEPPSARQAATQAFKLGIQWHWSKTCEMWRNLCSMRESRKKTCMCFLDLPQGLLALLGIIFWSILAIIPSILVTLAKLTQAMQVFCRVIARWLSPKHVNAAGPPMPLRMYTQTFDKSGPDQFSRVASTAFSAFMRRFPHLLPRADWSVRELPQPPGASENDGPWGWLLLDRAKCILLLIKRFQGLDYLDKGKWEYDEARGPFSHVSIVTSASGEFVLKCHVCGAKGASDSHKFISLPSEEAALIAFGLAAENMFL
eukprot:TRINITY_DN92523_c0_g1_i1.p1 TRINITY_DN92523_c0_g1~~TRINITY_DN92523_c0_g1_i1.p1  ORF type:complete len:938 (+),score=169.35 TRINITY_DN92523_c0_g1_i1:416-2815(+)